MLNIEIFLISKCFPDIEIVFITDVINGWCLVFFCFFFPIKSSIIRNRFLLLEVRINTRRIYFVLCFVGSISRRLNSICWYMLYSFIRLKPTIHKNSFYFESIDRSSFCDFLREATSKDVFDLPIQKCALEFFCFFFFLGEILHLRNISWK